MHACFVCVCASVCKGRESFSFNTSETERHSEIREWNLKRLSVSVCVYLLPLSPSHPASALVCSPLSVSHQLSFTFRFAFIRTYHPITMHFCLKVESSDVLYLCSLSIYVRVAKSVYIRIKPVRCAPASKPHYPKKVRDWISPQNHFIIRLEETERSQAKLNEHDFLYGGEMKWMSWSTRLPLFVFRTDRRKLWGWGLFWGATLWLFSTSALGSTGDSRLPLSKHECL